MSSSGNSEGLPTDLPDEILADLMSLIDDMGKGALSQTAPARDAKKKPAPAVESDAKKKPAPAVEDPAELEPVVESKAGSRPGLAFAALIGREPESEELASPVEFDLDGEFAVTSGPDVDLDIEAAALAESGESDTLALEVDFYLDEVDDFFDLSIDDNVKSRQPEMASDLLAGVSPDARIGDSGDRFSADWFRYNWPFLLAAFFMFVGAILILLVLVSN